MNLKSVYIALGGLVVIIIAFVIISFQVDGRDKTLEEQKQEVEMKMKEKKYSYTISEEQQNVLFIRNVMMQLMGDDYEYLLEMFSKEALPKDYEKMTENEISEFAKQIGTTIKDGKELAQGTVIDTKAEEDTLIYKISLQFKDGTLKTITLKVKNGKIITPLKELE